MIYAIVFLLALYCIFLLVLNIGWFSTKALPDFNGSVKRKYSVIIPFRNEEEALPELLHSLANLDFPKESYELIFVDDHSQDNSKVVIENYQSHLPNLKLFSSNNVGKKAAIETGIKQSQGEIIVTTDADCVVPENWLKTYRACFEDQQVKMAFGGVAFKQPKSFFEKLQQVEFASLIGSGASTLKLGQPSMCNGANLAFEKEVFYEVGGYSDNEHIASGDDEFLMHKIDSHFDSKVTVTFLKSRDAVVKTEAQKTIKDFFQQRKRWASKWKYYSKWQNSFLAVLVLLFNVSIIAGAVSLFFEFSHTIISLLALKLLLEFIFLQSVLNNLNSRLYLLPFIFLQICYPFYVVLFGLTANFGRYYWKGRHHKL